VKKESTLLWKDRRGGRVKRKVLRGQKGRVRNKIAEVTRGGLFIESGKKAPLTRRDTYDVIEIGEVIEVAPGDKNSEEVASSTEKYQLTAS